MKKIYIVSSTMRKKGNSELLAKSFMEGAKKNQNEVKFISLRDVNLKFCLGCLSCQETHKCVINDTMKELLDEISDSDVLVFATPIYYYGVSGQLKTFLDRLNPLFGRENKFKEVYLLASCFDSDKNAITGAKTQMEGFISCFDNLVLKDYLLATGVNRINDVNNTDFLVKAYELGANIK